MTDQELIDLCRGLGIFMKFTRAHGPWDGRSAYAVLAQALTEKFGKPKALIIPDYNEG